MNLGPASICALLLAFSTCASANGSAEQRTIRAPGYSSYLVDNAGGRRWQSRLSFSPNFMSFDGSSEFGAGLTYKETADARYLFGLPLSVPKARRKSWSYGRFNCSAVYARTEISMICLKLDTGARFSSFYTPSGGILWFDFYCAHYTTEVCRYRLDKGRGLFATV